MRVDEFDFTLDERLIALRPARPRDAARLLHVRKDGLAHAQVRDLPALLKEGDLLVANDARVIAAELSARRLPRRPGGVPQEQGPLIGLTLHRRLGPRCLEAFARPRKRLAAGDRLLLSEELTAEVLALGQDGLITLAFDREGAALEALLERLGGVPLPPYIARRRPPDEDDRRDYQTVFARSSGAVAAPTAGLHFTPELLAALEARGIGLAMVTLHVGAGTFLPVKAADTEDHVMHPERAVLTQATLARIEETRARGGRILCVGTTSLRVLESAADAEGRLAPFAGDTRLFITPGYRFRVADLLLTNFHLPRSTLFMLVCAFAGRSRMMAAYEAAMAEGYRFYSYGDACLLERVAEAG